MVSSSKKVVLLFLALSAMIAIVHCATPAPAPAPSSTGGTCPIDPLKLRVCVNVLNVVRLNQQCCPLLAGLADLDAAVCLCNAIKANVLGIVNVDLPLDLVLLVCAKTMPPGFTCPA
ncbi:unnamed protein product [Alopecurus aequalis]